MLFRSQNVVWHEEDRLEIHPFDAESRGVREGDLVKVQSRAGATSLRARITDRVAPGVVYTTFHHPDTQINVVTTDYSDWATKGDASAKVAPLQTQANDAYQAAVAAQKVVTELKADDPAAWFRLAQIETSANDAKGAIEAYREFIKPYHKELVDYFKAKVAAGT